MRTKEAREISIREYLDCEGIKPAKQRLSGRELWYSSPLRTGDSDPSFKVDTEKNLWFDFGLAKGGNVIDLVCELTNSTVKQALAILERSGANKSTHYIRNQQSPLPYPSSLQTSLLDKKNTVAGEKEKMAFEILAVSDIKDKALIDYLEERAIDLAIAKTYLKQVHFRPANKVKSYFALGMPSGDGFEVRNKDFKGMIGTKKEMTTLNLDNNKSLSIFEGFMDFLAFLSHQGNTNFQNSVIILNSINLKDRALKIINEYNFSKVYLFLDNDEAGKSTTQFFKDKITTTPVSDKSSLYKGYSDFNQMTMEKRND